MWLASCLASFTIDLAVVSPSTGTCADEAERG